MPEEHFSLEGDVVLKASMIDAFAETILLLHGSDDLESTLENITAAAVRTVDGCDVASLTMREGDRLVTRAPTGDLALRGDELQYELGEGPCLSATHQRGIHHTPDSAHDERWPTYSSRAAAELGVGGMVSCQLSAPGRKGHRSLGGVNLYATRANAFSDADLVFAALFAAHAAVVIDDTRRELQLREAIASRDVIGQAKGILMAQGGITSDDAFDQLRGASQRLNVKLKDLAAEVVARRESLSHGSLDSPSSDHHHRRPHDRWNPPE